jgi:peptidoglycan/xylan/chitin deacetylase (PgdA/CDA1 family)
MQQKKSWGQGLSKQIRSKMPWVYKFHKVSAERFEPLAKYLSSRKYNTLLCDEFYALVKSGRPFPKKSLMLTFDDGESGVWTSVYPLLEKYGLKATVFVLPGWMSETDYPRANLRDYWQGKATLGQIRDAASLSPFINWQEAYQMQKSGVIDIQSHTFSHHRCWIDSEIIDFQHPKASGEAVCSYLFTAIDAEPDANLWGCPIYTSRSRMMARRYFDDVGLRNACIDHVNRNSGLSFFKDPYWKKKLYRLVADYKSGHNLKEYFETESEQEKAIKHSLTRSKQLIESRLSKKCTALAYPWGEADIRTLDYAREVGYLMHFFGESLSFLPRQIERDNFGSCFFLSRVPGMADYPFIRDSFYKPKRLIHLVKSSLSRFIKRQVRI